MLCILNLVNILGHFRLSGLCISVTKVSLHGEEWVIIWQTTDVSDFDSFLCVSLNVYHKNKSKGGEQEAGFVCASVTKELQ